MEPSPTPASIVPRKKPAKMMPRPKRKPKPPPIAEASPPEPPARASWERYSDALCILIPRETDEFEQYLMRVSLLKARYSPYKEPKP